MREGWREVEIGDVAEVVGGGTPKTSIAEYWGGDIPWVTPTEITANDGGIISATERTLTELGLSKCGAKLLPAGAVLLTSRATIGAAAIAGVPLTTNQGFASLVCSDEVLPEYLMHWCRHNKQEFISRAGGNTFLEIAKGKVKEVKLDLPPLDEQRRIVDLIAAVDEALAGTRRAAQATSNVYRSALLDGFGVRGSTWPVHPMSELSTARLGKMLNKAAKTGVDEYPYVRNADVQWDELRVDELNTMYFSEADRREFALREGDVLICEGGEVGRAAVVEHDLENVYFQKAIHRVRCGPSLLPRFLMHYMRYCAETGVLSDYSTALTIMHLTGEKLRTLPTPAPPTPEQSQLVALLDAALECTRIAEIQSQALEASRAALLTDLLSGDHEIPASYDALLEAAVA